jgi:hypothetical protein
LSVFAEEGGRHKAAHCHVSWPDGDARLSLPSLRKIVGVSPPGQAIALAREYLPELCDEWTRQNPNRPVEAKEVRK